MISRFDFAPLDGITKRVFRRVWHNRFGGADPGDGKTGGRLCLGGECPGRYGL